MVVTDVCGKRGLDSYGNQVHDEVPPQEKERGPVRVQPLTYRPHHGREYANLPYAPGKDPEVDREGARLLERLHAL